MEEADRDKRIDVILTELLEVRRLLESQNSKVAENAEAIARLQERVAIGNAVQTFLIVLASSIAAYVGIIH